MGRIDNFPIGYSDHTMGIEVSLMAVSLGACLIEKHFTLDRNMSGPDHKASSEPSEIRALVQGIRNIEKSFGSFEKKPTLSEEKTLQVARKSLVSNQKISKGDVIDSDMIDIKRPGVGILPKDICSILGKTAIHDIEADVVLKKEDFE